MISFFNQWLMSVVAATILIGVAEVLMPTGAVKQVGKLTCGLLLLLTIVRPILRLSDETLEDIGNHWHGDLAVQVSDMENFYQNQIKTIIEQELATYILDKAMEAEKTKPYSIRVECTLGEDGVFLPEWVEIVGSEDEDFFCTMISRDLGVEVVTFKEVEDENMENSPSF